MHRFVSNAMSWRWMSRGRGTGFAHFASRCLPGFFQCGRPSLRDGFKPAPRIRRRNRMITSCLECRRRKLKCNKSHPCTNCVKFQRDCVFLAPALDQASQLKLTEIKEKVGSLERLLERDVAKNAAQQSASSQSLSALPAPYLP
jgi:hypothetical protein